VKHSHHVARTTERQGEQKRTGDQVTPESAVHSFPVSVSLGAADLVGRVLLLENERMEWELPGGKLELGEDPPACLVREIGEEAGWRVTAGLVLDCWQYHIREGRDVVIVTHGCYVASTTPPVVSSEHKRAALLTRNEISHLDMPGGYKRSIKTWFTLLTGDCAALCGKGRVGPDAAAAG
jgi:8-oxo-dGTP pyrophosphatase MutT (NUDIX family)